MGLGLERDLERGAKERRRGAARGGGRRRGSGGDARRVEALAVEINERDSDEPDLKAISDSLFHSQCFLCSRNELD